LKHQLKDIFDAYYNPLCNYAITILKDKQKAEDVIQTIFIQLWESDKIYELENPEPYLLRCVKYKCIDELRSSKTASTLSIDDLPEIEAAGPNDLKEQDIIPLMHYFATKLPPKMRQVFLLSRQNKMSYKQIAAQLNISVKTVENHMSAALKKLRRMLMDYGYLSLLFLVLS